MPRDILSDPVPAVERLCNDIAERMRELCQEIDRQRVIVRDLLSNAGTASNCRGPNCRKEIVFVMHVHTHRLTPYNLDGTNHYTTCVDRDLFNKRSTHATRTTAN
jgi:hypothetical protein